MQTRTGQQSPSLVENSSDLIIPLKAAVSNRVTQKPRDWSDGRKRFLNHHQEKYLQRLTQLREALIKEKDILRLSLPQSGDKNTGFWEVIMTDVEDASPNNKFPQANSSHKSYQSSAGGGLNSELNRRGHLERLRRIRIMQMRRKLPPQLEPLQGIGIASRRRTENTPIVANKNKFSMQSTAFHVNWMRGNHLVTPMVDQEKDIAEWTMKQMRLLHPKITYDSTFPIEFKTQLSRRNPSADFPEKPEKMSQERQPSSNPHQTSSSYSHRSKASSSSKGSRQSSPRKLAGIHPVPHSNSSSPPLRIESISKPNLDPACMQDILSHNSPPSSRIAGSTGTVEDDSENNSLSSIVGDDSRPKMVDRASSPVGFRLPPLKRHSRASVSSSANSKKQIIVKIPDGTA